MKSTTKEKILSAAGELFIEGGVDALTVRDIAKRAGFSTIGIYSYFKGKQGILDALYIEGFEIIARSLEVPEKLSPHQAILKMAANYLKAAINHKAHYNLIYGPTDRAYQPSEEAKQVGAATFVQLTRVMAKRLPPESTLDMRQSFALQVWAYLHGSVSLSGHAIAGLVNMDHWRERTLKTLDTMIEALSESSLATDFAEMREDEAMNNH